MDLSLLPALSAVGRPLQKEVVYDGAVVIFWAEIPYLIPLPLEAFDLGAGESKVATAAHLEDRSIGHCDTIVERSGRSPVGDFPRPAAVLGE